MAVLKSPAQNTPTGKLGLTPTEKRTLVSARDVMATIQDALGQAKRAGMKTASKTYSHNGVKVAVIAFAITDFDVVAEGGTFQIDGRAITDPSAWDDLRDVMADASPLPLGDSENTTNRV
jgi:hypothetical protein